MPLARRQSAFGVLVMPRRAVDPRFDESVPAMDRRFDAALRPRVAHGGRA